MIADENNQPLSKLFWESFLREKDKLRKMVFAGEISSAYYRIGELLTLSNYSNVYEITCSDELAILVFTPESDQRLAIVVDAFVNDAPTIPGWKIVNRRQRKPVEDALSMLEEVYDVELTDLAFSIEKADAGFNVIMYTTAADILGEPEKEGFVSFFLEHALGEEVSMALIFDRSVGLPNGSRKMMEPSLFVATVIEVAEARGILQGM